MCGVVGKPIVATPFWAKCEGEAHTPKSGNLESSGTPENLELESKGQNTSHWDVLGVIGKVLKCRCLNWLTLAIWTSAAQVMGKRRAGIQTGSLTPDHKKSRIDLFPTSESGVRHGVGKLSTRATSLVKARPDPSSEREVMNAQSPGSPNRDSFGTPPWESREKEPFGCSLRAKLQRIL
jgi:hypothetical protein